MLANGQAVYVTARHVIEDLAADPDLDPLLFLPKSIHDASENLFVGLSIEQVAMAESHSDVALLRVDLRTAEVPINGTLSHVRIGLRRPELGQRMLALGYPKQVILDGEYFVRDFRATSGLVMEVFDDQRDAGLGSFPSFRMTGLLEHGMSGGPVFSQNGDVVGVVSWGWPPQDDIPPDGYAASIAGLAELRIDLQDDEGIEREFTFAELVQIGAITTAGVGVRLTRQHDGVKLTWL
jgi:S1-C subfamily serine protease